VIRSLVLIAVLGCHGHDKDKDKDSDNGSGLAAGGDAHPVVLHLTRSSIEVAAKTGKHTFQLETDTPSAQLVKPVVDAIFAAGGKDGVTVWGRYEAPDVWNALAPALSDVPTTI
jgi:hypothetical protein